MEVLPVSPRRLSGLIFGLMGGLSEGLIGRLIFGLIGELSEGLIVRLIGGLISGLVVGVRGWLRGTLQHYTLRRLLTAADILPHGIHDRHLVTYLDTMTERIFLRRIGGGWEFIHRYLLDYFAALTPDEIEEIVAKLKQT